jgi:RND family efflux transporter MFP subunit
MRNRVVLAALGVPAVVAFTVWGASIGESAGVGSPQVVTVHRGDVAVTVGGIGHVATLAEAARRAAPAADSVSSAAGSGPSTVASTEAVFANATGHLASLLVRVGDHVDAGQPIASVADDGTAEAVLLQAGTDLATARLELAQKRVQDPSRGAPPTAAELASGRQAVLTAQDNLRLVTGSPSASERATARLELDKARAELAAEQAREAGLPDALAAAQLAVTTATQKLALVSGLPDPAELAAAQLEVAKTTLELETLLRATPVASAAAVAAAEADVAAAQLRLTEARSTGDPVEIATAEADLARTVADREALTALDPPPTAAAVRAATLAVDAAQERLDQLVVPPAATVTAARSELASAQADLATLSLAGNESRTAAATAVTVAKRRLDLLLKPPPEIVSTARLELTRAAADLSVLRQRGAPASGTDLAIARLRVDVGEQQVRLARAMAGRLTVLANASGTVTSMLTAVGAAVDPTVPLVRIQDLDHLVVSLNLTEFDVSRTRVGAAVRISADALAGRPYAGRVVDVALSGSDTGGVVTFPVIASVDQPKDLRPGMSVSVRVVVASAEDVVRLPLGAIQDRAGSHATITVRTASGKTLERDVKLGLVGAAYAEVRSGLVVGERVVIPAEDEA